MSARPLSQLLTMAREALDELRALRQAVQDTDRDRRRRGYGLGDVVTVSEAARVLGMDYASTRRLVLERGLVREYNGRQRVLVRDLLDCDDESWNARVRSNLPGRVPKRRRLASWDDIGKGVG